MKKLELKQMENIEGGSAWWDCMTRGYSNLTSTWQGTVALGLYLEPITVGMGVICVINPNN